MPRNPNERPVKPHTLDRRAEQSLYRGTPRERQKAQRDIRNAISRPVKPEHLDRADRGIDPGKKPAKH